MTTYSRLLTPVGELVLTASDAALTGVYFPTSRRGGPPTHHAEWVESKGEGPVGEILTRTAQQLDGVMAGEVPEGLGE